VLKIYRGVGCKGLILEPYTRSKREGSQGPGLLFYGLIEVIDKPLHGDRRLEVLFLDENPLRRNRCELLCYCLARTSIDNLSRRLGRHLPEREGLVVSRNVVYTFGVIVGPIGGQTFNLFL
jgi:hypothetical protein